MRLAIVVAAGALAMVGVAADSAPTRSGIEHFPAPLLNGRAPPFSSAVRVGDVLYLSGQIGIGPDGKLPDGIEAQSKQALDNIGIVLKRAGLSYGDLFHCTAFLSDMKNWPAFNTVYVPYFPAGKLPARSAVGVTALALPGALMEIECQAYAGGRK
jgi:2-iminobutanoate/2-iminopropanoate deaminase